jgi:hypothetical protein
MLDQQITDSFIVHEQELKAFDNWFVDTDPTAPWILFFHDALDQPDRKAV